MVFEDSGINKINNTYFCFIIGPYGRFEKYKFGGFWKKWGDRTKEGYAMKIMVYMQFKISKRL